MIKKSLFALLLILIFTSQRSVNDDDKTGLKKWIFYKVEVTLLNCDKTYVGKLVDVDSGHIKIEDKDKIEVLFLLPQ